MRKLIVSESVTLDGIFEGPVHLPFEKFEQAGWTEPYFGEDQMKYLSEGMSGGDALLLGRATYEYFEAAWSPQTGALADFMNNVTKYVVSTTLEKVGWHNSVLIQGNVVEKIRTLKQQNGKDIAILGSGALVRSLLDFDLIDEYSLLVHPVILGTGMHLFEKPNQMSLRLKEAKAFSSGVVLLSYEPDRE